MSTDRVMHTTGPWRVDGAYVVGAAGVIVRQAAPYSEAPDDLRLIAAAPMLLAFAELLVSTYHEEGVTNIEWFAHEAQRLIAAATGETK